MYGLIDISKWEDDRMASYGGYTRKCGKISPDGTHYMVKFEKKHTFKSFPLNLFQQHINSEIIRMLGFQAQETFIATHGDYLVLCCKDFVPEGSKLVNMDVFLRTLYNSYELTEITNLGQFEHVMDTHPILKPYKESLTKSFWDMVVIDMFLTNFSRSTSDYGYLVSEHEVTQAPLWDTRTDTHDMFLPIRTDEKILTYEELLYGGKHKPFYASLARILPIFERNIGKVYKYMDSQEILSKGQIQLLKDILRKSLTNLQLSYKLQQVASTMSIENMNLTEQAYANLQSIATGQKTVDEVVEEIKRRYF